MELKRFNVGKGRDVLEWLISLDDPDSPDYPAAAMSVTLTEIIAKARECFTLEFSGNENPPHPFVPYAGRPVRCASASRTDPNTVCWKTSNHPDHNIRGI